MKLNKKLRTILIILGAIGFALFLVDFAIVERCLDMGHRFDYSSYSCEGGAQ